MKKYSILFILLILSSHLSAAIQVLNGLTHMHPTAAGGQISGKILLKNESAKEARILIYKQDLIANCGNAIAYTTINTHNRSLGNWLQTNIDEKILLPHEEYTLFYTINVPKDSIEKGTYWSVLMIEGADPIKEENTNGMQVNSKVRYAIQVLADVGGFESPKLTFEDVKYEAKEKNNKTLKVRVKNDGLCSAKTKVSIEIFSDKGLKIKGYEAVQKRIYPNLCNEFELLLDDMPQGKYEGVLVADNGKDIFGSNITIDIE
ncbi:MAG: hypothetical protein U5L45_05590 [Saprospiraceae bacterium]|nr:hypothetical protein [Saprospiraceae bacterium]